MSSSPRILFLVLATLASASVIAGPAPRHAVPGGGGGGMYHGGAPSHAAPRGGVPPRGQVPGHGTANGIARYGYGYGYGSGYGYGYGYGYPCWGGYYGGYYPYWNVGFYGSWGWPWYGGYGYYGGYYGDGGYGYPSDSTYVMGGGGPPPQTPVTIVTKVSPADAEVLLDDQSVGYAKDYNGRWDTLSAAPGRHTVTFRSEGFKTLRIDLEAQPGGHYVFDNTMTEGEGEEHHAMGPPPAPPAAAAPSNPPASSPVARGRLTVRAMPEDAAVYLDGEYLGMAGELGRLHGAIPVATGTHRLEVVRPGYAGDVRMIDVNGQDVAAIDLVLAKTP
jgi:hypothetical protein